MNRQYVYTAESSEFFTKGEVYTRQGNKMSFIRDDEGSSHSFDGDFLQDFFKLKEEDVIYENPETGFKMSYEAKESPTDYNVGNSDYSKRTIQPWMIWEEYELNPWDADIVKRVLRTKKGESRQLDYEKIIHICKYRISKLEESVDKK